MVKSGKQNVEAEEDGKEVVPKLEDKAVNGALVVEMFMSELKSATLLPLSLLPEAAPVEN